MIFPSYHLPYLFKKTRDWQNAVVPSKSDEDITKPAFQKHSSRGENRPRVLFLMPTHTYRASMFLEAAERLDVEVVVGSEQQQVLEPFTTGKTLTLDFNDEKQSTRLIVEFASRYPLDAIIAVDDDTAVLAALVCDALSLPANPPEAVKATRQKHTMRSILSNAGQPSPEFSVFTSADKAKDISASVHYPCVLKPVFLSASQGVIRANNPQEFEQAFARIVKLLNRNDIMERGGEQAEFVLVEDYIPGKEFALEGIYCNDRLKVLALFDKPDPLEGPYFEETIYVTPSRLPVEIQNEIIQCVDQAAKTLGLIYGPVHAEIRINDNRPIILEIAARSIGGLCSRTLRFGKNVSLEELILRHALGSQIETIERESCAAGVMMIPIPKAGILKEVRGLEWAKGEQNIEDVKITIPLNQKLVPLPEGNKYLGFIFSRHKSPQGVEKALRDALEKLEFVIEKTE